MKKIFFILIFIVSLAVEGQEILFDSAKTIYDYFPYASEKDRSMYSLATSDAGNGVLQFRSFNGGSFLRLDCDHQDFISLAEEAEVDFLSKGLSTFGFVFRGTINGGTGYMVFFNVSPSSIQMTLYKNNMGRMNMGEKDSFSKNIEFKKTYSRKYQENNWMRMKVKIQNEGTEKVKISASLLNIKTGDLLGSLSGEDSSEPLLEAGEVAMRAYSSNDGMIQISRISLLPLPSPVSAQ